MIRTTLLALSLSLATTTMAQPTTATTGPKGTLKASSGMTITKDGSIIEGLDISGAVSVKADNVTIRNCRIRTTGSYGINATFGAKNLVVYNTEIRDMQSAGIYGGNFTATRCHVWNSGNDAFKPTFNAVIEDCLIEKLGYLSSAHADGVQMVGGGNVIIRRNNFDMPRGVKTEGIGTASTYKNSQAIIIQTNNSKIDSIVIEDNWINGGGYSIQIRDKGTNYGAPTNVRIINNTFGRGAQFGPWQLDGNVTKYGNRWADTGALLDGQTTGPVVEPPKPEDPKPDDPKVPAPASNLQLSRTMTTPLPEPPYYKYNAKIRAIYDAYLKAINPVTLSWKDGSDNEDGFMVLRDGNEVGRTPADFCAFSDVTAPPAATYQVVAFNEAGQAAPSNTATVTLRQ